MKYTPGPCDRTRSGLGLTNVEASDGNLLAECQHLTGGIPLLEREANARLIAASPTMLRALKLEAERACQLCRNTDRRTDYQAIWNRQPTRDGAAWVHWKHDKSESFPCSASPKTLDAIAEAEGLI